VCLSFWLGCCLRLFCLLGLGFGCRVVTAAVTAAAAAAVAATVAAAAVVISAAVAIA